MNTTKTIEQNLADIIVNGAFEFMAAKAGVSVDAIKSVVFADQTGNAARRFAELVSAGANNIDAVIESVRTGKPVTTLA